MAFSSCCKEEDQYGPYQAPATAEQKAFANALVGEWTVESAEGGELFDQMTLTINKRENNKEGDFVVEGVTGGNILFSDYWFFEDGKYETIDVGGTVRVATIDHLASEDMTMSFTADEDAYVLHLVKDAEAGQGDKDKVYVTASGAGEQDGSSWENAIEGNREGGLNAAWALLGETGTMMIEGGLYDVPQTLNINNSGASATGMKIIEGVDKGAGLPVFEGVWQEGDNSVSFIRASTNASFWAVKNIIIKNYANGIETRGRHETIEINNVTVDNCFYGLSIRGGATASNAEQGTHDVAIEGVTVKHFVESAVKIFGGTYKVTVSNSYADQGGEAFFQAGRENFPIAFSVGNDNDDEVNDSEINFINVRGENIYHANSGGWWNGYVFNAGTNARKITYTNCFAKNSTGTGFGDRSPAPVLTNCISIANTQNFRFWSTTGATVDNCLAAFSYRHGGDDNRANTNNFWTEVGSKVTVQNSTIYQSSTFEVVSRGATTLTNCIVSNSLYEDVLWNLEGKEAEGAAINWDNTIRHNTAQNADPEDDGNDPNLKNPTQDWDGMGDNFDSQEYADKGFSSTRS
ncbi:hypothetical protein PEPS_31020 (plasmid) [Persicobacter psychrovividus]|uniref:Uncharacterized protein n=2 Tax=Persicobacter psychrovividus TaxID=387638 RepID=A0ABM7VIM4_9BACT|nr:hypothetical protein PEPS_31020 [Persicobacter psychrovividus]